MKIISNSFSDGGVIAPHYAMKAIAGGKNISPHIKISDIPQNAKSLAIAFIDRHPMAQKWVHWLVISVPPQTIEIPESASLSLMPGGSIELVNTFGRKGYGGPQPPRGSGLHNYELAVYALSEGLALKEGEYAERHFLDAAKNKILAVERITAKFENK